MTEIDSFSLLLLTNNIESIKNLLLINYPHMGMFLSFTARRPPLLKWGDELRPAT